MSDKIAEQMRQVCEERISSLQQFHEDTVGRYQQYHEYTVGKHRQWLVERSRQARRDNIVFAAIGMVLGAILSAGIILVLRFFGV